MNDVRNLMGHLQGQMEYKEFGESVRPPAGAWPILQRVGRMAPPNPTPEDPPQEIDEPPAEPARRAPLVSGLKRPKRSLLNRYAPAEAAEAAHEEGRRLPLAEVFARLAAGR